MVTEKAGREKICPVAFGSAPTSLEETISSPH